MKMQTPEDFGTESDGSHSSEFCRYCYEGGSYRAPDMTIDQMVDILVKDMYQSDADGDVTAKTRLVGLKRWQ